MGKVFTITEGLENMGALKSGGQGSVYKARRSDSTITAVKLLPTPVFSESGEDTNFLYFQNEVEKLQKVNETSNPHVVSFLSSGITETGSFPFIEMEFIEGPDLEELLKPPHKALFKISEVIKVAKHISNALAHCHKAGVKHGDIKTNNIKLNTISGNYVLLDFGLALLSDEQRRTSMRHAGAIEFMAPEQNNGELLFQTDVYSFGIILYELLSGQVPFPLNETTETARNNVMAAHMETAPPDLSNLRRQNLPYAWPQDKKEAEMQAPHWLLTMIEKCLQKDPMFRFANAVSLYEYIIDENTRSTKVSSASIKKESNSAEQMPDNENKSTPQVIATAGQTFTLRPKDEIAADLKKRKARRKKEQVRKKALPVVIFLSLLAIGLLAYAAYSYLGKNNNAQYKPPETAAVTPKPSDVRVGEEPINDPSPEVEKPVAKRAEETITRDDENKEEPITSAGESGNDNSNNNKSLPPVRKTNKIPGDETIENKAIPTAKYKVRSKAFFHNQPDESTRRKAFIVHWNNAVLTPLDEEDNFVYIVFTNDLGQTSKGWLRIKDLIKVQE